MGLGLLMAEPCLAQGLSTLVFPSEDEIVEALQSGDIDYYQYLILLELSQNGIDNENLYLLDEIPNLWFVKSDTSETDQLSSEQRSAFQLRRRSEGTSASVRHRYVQKLNEESQSAYQTNGKVWLEGGYRGSFGIRRDYSGRERWVERSIGYVADSGIVRAVRFGSITERFGLGSIIGYRGKLLHYDDELSGESLLYPDFGGFNGLSLHLVQGKTDGRALVSYSRDSANELITLAGLSAVKYHASRVWFQAGWNRLKSQTSGRRFEYVKVGVGVESRYADGEVRAEISSQGGNSAAPGCMLVEGTHAIATQQIRYAGWVYSRNFVDLSGGSKAASIRRNRLLPDIEFNYSDKRAGQKGALVKTTTALAANTNLLSSILVAGFNRDTLDIQAMAAVQRTMSEQCSGRIDYLTTTKQRDTVGGKHVDTDHRVRLEARFSHDKLAIRSYIGIRVVPSQRGTVSLFTSIKMRMSGTNQLELWSNLSRMVNRQLEHGYLYIRVLQRLLENTDGAIKVTNTYNRTSTPRFQTAISLEVTSSI